MVWLLRYCPKCGRYTLNQEKCPVCGGDVKVPHPAKFSIDDRYQNYRLKLMRIQKREEEEKEKVESPRA